MVFRLGSQHGLTNPKPEQGLLLLRPTFSTPIDARFKDKSKDFIFRTSHEPEPTVHGSFRFRWVQNWGLGFRVPKDFGLGILGNIFSFLGTISFDRNSKHS